jgi:trigger factor
MQVTKKDLEKSQIELTIELTFEEFKPYIEKGAQKVSQNIKIEGFRSGKVPYEILKQKIGEMTILEEAAHLAIHKTIDEAIENNTLDRMAVGQPKVEITKLAPENPLEYKAVLAIVPTVALGEYKNLKIKPAVATVEDQEIVKTLAELQEMKVKEVISEQPVKTGDKVLVDIDLTLDKVPVEGGSTKDLAVIIGKNYFVEGFDKQLLEMTVGETRLFSLPFPENHHQQNLAGKMVEFKVKVNSIFSRELPEINDEFAVDFRFKDLEDLKKTLKDNILTDHQHQAENKTELEMLDAIVSKTNFGEIPEVLVENEVHNMMHELEDNLVKQGSTMDDYLKQLNKTANELTLDLLPNAIKRIKTALIMKEIAAVEKIEVSETEIANKITELKERYKSDHAFIKMMADPSYGRYLSNVMLNEKVLIKLKDWNYANPGSEQKS